MVVSIAAVLSADQSSWTPSAWARAISAAIVLSIWTSRALRPLIETWPLRCASASVAAMFCRSAATLAICSLLSLNHWVARLTSSASLIGCAGSSRSQDSSKRFLA